MLSNRNRRGGFTLPEVLVTVAIVSVLAAIVVPAVTQQLGKGDLPAVNSSLQGMSTAITSFVSDVRRFPGQVDHLQAQPIATDWSITATGATVPAAVYSTGSLARWRGPYDNTGSITGIVPIGMGWNTTNVLYDSLGYVVVPVSKTAADVTDAAELDALIDENNGATVGRVRWLPGAAPALNPANTIRLFLMSSAR